MTGSNADGAPILDERHTPDRPDDLLSPSAVPALDATELDATELDATELAARDAACARGCANYWPHRGRPWGPASRWTIGACALTPGCTEQSCLWLRR